MNTKPSYSETSVNFNSTIIRHEDSHNPLRNLSILFRSTKSLPVSWLPSPPSHLSNPQFFSHRQLSLEHFLL